MSKSVLWKLSGIAVGRVLKGLVMMALISGQVSPAMAASTGERFTFLAYGDNRAGANCSDNADHMTLVSRMKDEPADMVLHLGDMVTGYANTTNWVQDGGCTNPTSSGSFKKQIAPLQGKAAKPGLATFFYPVLGNHDDNWGARWYPDPYGNGICDVFDSRILRTLIPNHTRQPYFRDKTHSGMVYTDDEFYSRLCTTDRTRRGVYPRYFYYSFDYKNSHFLVLRINWDWHDLLACNRSCTPENHTNYDLFYNIHELHFLQYDLAKARANPSIKHIFAFTHAPVFTSGDDHPGSSSRQVLSQEFSKAGVKIVFTSHNHNYERTVPIYATAERPAGVRDDVVGTTYIVSGGGGSPLVGFKPQPWFSVVQRSVKHYVRVSVDGEEISVTSTDIKGSIIDQFSLGK
jgi:hypothetical protein